MHLTFKELDKSAKDINCFDRMNFLNEAPKLIKKEDEIHDYEESFEGKCIVCGNPARLDKKNTCIKCRKEFPVKETIKFALTRR